MKNRALAKWMFVVGLLLGLFYAAGGLIIDLFTIGLNLGTVMAFGAIIALPVLFGAFGVIVDFVIKLVMLIKKKVTDVIYKKS
ncbi:MAG: hypothetical protein ACJZ77_00365 [Pseudohongiellaceae bacterium]